MAEIKVDIEAVCECGNQLTIHQDTWSGNIKVDPCEKCKQEAYDEGLNDGAELEGIKL